MVVLLQATTGILMLYNKLLLSWLYCPMSRELCVYTNLKNLTSRGPCIVIYS